MPTIATIRSCFMTLCCSLTMALLSLAFAAERPNIIVLLADDAGYSDFSCYGSKVIKTPHIDQLAKDGIRFTDYYAPAPNCSPSRAGLLTGRIPSRIGIYNYINPGSPMHLPEEEITIASLLKEAGYQTCVSGKWHLNSSLTNDAYAQPHDHGFDHWFCTDNNASPNHHQPVNFIRNGKKVAQTDDYSCQVVVKEAITWLDQRDTKKPFFLFIPFHEPHTPIASPPDLVARHSGKKAKYNANIENIDRAVGQLLAHLKTNKLTDNTIVMFASDNGGTSPTSNQPLRGRKSNVWDGGIREPGIIRWPGQIKAGQVSSEPVSAVDLLPTLCDILDIEQPGDRNIDGTSILPILQGKDFKRDTPLFWFFYRVDPSVAMRQDDWMLIGYLGDRQKKFGHSLSSKDIPYIKSAQIERFELFNMRTDISQSKDLAGSEGKRLQAMKAQMITLHASVVAEGREWWSKGKKK